MSELRKTGTVISLRRDKAYGFIAVEGEQDYFFHKNALADGLTLDDLHDGQDDAQPTAVTFVVGTNKTKDKLQAQDVRLA